MVHFSRRRQGLELVSLVGPRGLAGNRAAAWPGRVLLRPALLLALRPAILPAGLGPRRPVVLAATPGRRLGGAPAGIGPAAIRPPVGTGTGLGPAAVSTIGTISTVGTAGRVLRLVRVGRTRGRAAEDRPRRDRRPLVASRAGLRLAPARRVTAAAAARHPAGPAVVPAPVGTARRHRVRPGRQVVEPGTRRRQARPRQRPARVLLGVPARGRAIGLRPGSRVAFGPVRPVLRRAAEEPAGGLAGGPGCAGGPACGPPARARVARARADCTRSGRARRAGLDPALGSIRPCWIQRRHAGRPHRPGPRLLPRRPRLRPRPRRRRWPRRDRDESRRHGRPCRAVSGQRRPGPRTRPQRTRRRQGPACAGRTWSGCAPALPGRGRPGQASGDGRRRPAACGPFPPPASTSCASFALAAAAASSSAAVRTPGSASTATTTIASSSIAVTRSCSSALRLMVTVPPPGGSRKAWAQPPAGEGTWVSACPFRAACQPPAGSASSRMPPAAGAAPDAPTAPELTATTAPDGSTTLTRAGSAASFHRS